MIVRDEEAVIERALRSAIPWITTWCIVDTGSTDRTKEVIRRTLGDISGTLYERPWVNFGHNRTEALTLCKAHAEWAIMLDADDNLAGLAPSRDLWDHLEMDAMAMRIKHDQIWHNRIQIFRLDTDWCYEGVIHEQARCRGTSEPKVLMLPAEMYMETRCAGVRSRDPQKYIKDATLLEAEHVRNPTDTRTLFYLAQSYRDAGRRKEAAHYYKKYLEQGDGTPLHERYMANTNMILLSEDPIEQIAFGWAAMELCPTRLEAAFSVMQQWRNAQRKPTQQLFALAAACTNRKAVMEWPYVNPIIYNVGFDDEFAVVAFHAGRYQEAYDASVRCVLGAQDATAREKAVQNVMSAKAAMERSKAS
jgi:glycosyltransferase involved in cell wall biosynthesis